MPSEIDIFRLQTDILFKDEEFIRRVTEFSARFDLPREEVIKRALQFYMEVFAPVLATLALFDHSAPVSVYRKLANPDEVATRMKEELSETMTRLLSSSNFEVDLSNISLARLVMPTTADYL